MSCVPRWLERERVQHVKLAVVASNCQELRSRGPRDRGDAETRRGGIGFEIAHDSAIRRIHQHTAEQRHTGQCRCKLCIVSEGLKGDLHSRTQSQTAIILPSGDQEHPQQSRVGSCVRFARTQPVALQKMDRKSTQSCEKDMVQGRGG